MSINRDVIGGADYNTGTGAIDPYKPAPVQISITAIGAITPAADTIAYFTGPTTAASTALTAVGRTFLAAANLAAQKTALGLTIGADVQAWDADLDALAALSGTNTIYYRSAANTWTAVTIGSGLSFAAGTLAATGGGGTVTGVTGTAPIVSSGGTAPAISIAAATTGAAGSMSAADKTKLDAISGTNTGDQTSVTGNAGTATKLATARNINGVAFDGTANITVPAVDTATPRLTAASNLSDVANAGTARANLRNSCKVTISASLAGNDFSAGYIIPWNTETWDDANWHDNTTNPERLTVPANVDRVELIVGLRLTGLTASVQVLVQILKNVGGTVVASGNFFANTTSQLLPLVGLDACVAGDYYYVKVTQGGGTTSGTVATAGSVQFAAMAV